LQREREAEARRLEWLRLRDYARRQHYLEAVRRADEIARAAVGDSAQLVRDAWGSGEGADVRAAMRRTFDQELRDVATPHPHSSRWDGMRTSSESDGQFATDKQRNGPNFDTELATLALNKANAPGCVKCR